MTYSLRDRTFDGHYLVPLKIKQGPVEINTTVSAYIRESPKPIALAKLDGTKYVVYDPDVVNKDKWVVASYNLNHWEPFVETHITELNPTHFVTYYGWDVV